MTPSTLAAVVICYDNGRTLDAIVRTLSGMASEIVVVDEGSTDPFTLQALAALEAAGHRVARCGRRGGAARNLGVALATASLVVVVNASDSVEPVCFGRAVERLRADGDALFVTASGPLGWTGLMASAQAPIAPLFRRSLHSAIGGFDETLGPECDLDFWARVLETAPRGEKPVTIGGYARLTVQGLPADAVERVYRKHAARVADHVEAILVAKERLILELKTEQATLEERSRTLSSQLADMPAPPSVDLGDLRRTSPISTVWGLDRGKPLDRHYIEAFLNRHRRDIRGLVLEVKDAGYTQMFGDDRVAGCHVVDIDATNERATIVADLTRAEGIPADTYDCFILTQTLGVIYDVRAALATAARILKPGGVLLCTLPAAGRISYEGRGLDGDYWRFTEASVRRLFSEVFAPDAFSVDGFGNVLACSAFLYGLAPQELSREELDATDPFFPLVYGVRAIKGDIVDLLIEKDLRARPILESNYELERSLGRSLPPHVGAAPVGRPPATDATSVAVVITCFNQADTIRQAVNSALGQTRFVAEVIVVDDGSTDSATVDLLAALSSPRVRVLTTANHGLASARNHGIQASTAELVVTLDGDDCLDPLYVERVAGQLDEDPSLDFVGCAMRAFEGADYVWKPSGDLVGGLAKGSFHASTMFRRAVFSAVGGFDPALPAFETSDFWATAIEKGLRGIVLDEPLLWYRVRPRSKYHATIGRERFIAARRALLQKHRSTVVSHREQLLAEADAFLAEITAYGAHLRDRVQGEGPESRAAVMRSFIGAPVLLYHRVGHVPSDARNICMAPAVFREHMRHLREHCQPLPLSSLLEAADADRIPERAVAVTFDDGYFDVLTTIVPILDEFGIPATFFANSADFDAGAEFWGDTLERVFLECDDVPTVCTVRVGTCELSLPTGSSGERLEAWKEINARMYPLDAEARADVIDRIKRWSGRDLLPRASHRRMTSYELASLALNTQHEIGAHTLSHLDLTKHGADVRRHEMVWNKRNLERATGRAVNILAYPYGLYDDETVTITRECGFTAAVTVDAGTVRAGVDRFRIPRAEPPALDPRAFAAFVDRLFSL